MRTNRLLSLTVEWMRLPDGMPSAEQIRVRLFCIACLCFTAAASLNFLGLTWALGLLAPQLVVSLFIAISGAMLLLLLRQFKDPILLTWVFAIMATLGGWISAYVDYMAATEITGIGLAYSPYMIAILVVVCLLGTRRAAIFYAGLCIATLLGFYQVTVALDFPADILQQNRMSVVIRSSAILLTLGIMVPVTSMIYSTFENLEKTVEHANVSDAARKELLATVSHEIRTPLHGIIGLSDMLNRAELPEPHNKPARLIHVSANNLMEIVNEVLDMANLENGTLKIRAKPFSPRTMVQDICDLFETKAAEKNLWIGSNVDPDVPDTLVGDEPHLRQILSNLTGNAIKFTHDGGIRIGARLASVQDGDVIIQFYVQDTGVGISKDEQTNVFDRFTQTASAQTSKTKGTGLGLSICQELTHRMGGKLELASEPGKGSVFYFSLPLSVPDTASDQAA